VSSFFGKEFHLSYCPPELFEWKIKKIWNQISSTLFYWHIFVTMAMEMGYGILTKTPDVQMKYEINIPFFNMPNALMDHWHLSNSLLNEILKKRIKKKVNLERM